MKKIIIVTGDIVYGGAERISVYLANYFSKQGIRVFLISTSNLLITIVIYVLIMIILLAIKFTNGFAIIFSIGVYCY